jgi:hypothetical protein
MDPMTQRCGNGTRDPFDRFRERNIIGSGSEGGMDAVRHVFGGGAVLLRRGAPAGTRPTRAMI